MHEIDDFDYYVIAERTEFTSDGDFVSIPCDLANKYTDIIETQSLWLDNLGWL